jgi:hypothetical protein
MCWVTYTERNMTEFISYDRTKEVVVVNPLFAELRSSMTLRKLSVEEVNFSSFTLKQFNTGYLIKNQPVKVKNMASNWNATQKWNF